MQCTPLIHTLGRLSLALAILSGLLLSLGVETAAARGAREQRCQQLRDMPASFEAAYYADHFIRHSNSLGLITKTDNELDRKDATFTVHRGLSGTPNSVSFESSNYPGQFLRHENYRIKLAPRQDSQLFRQDASFLVVDAEGCDVRFESVNLRGHYIRHQNYELWLANETAGSTSLFVQDTTWHWETPRWKPVDVKHKDVTPSELTALRTSDEDKEEDSYYRSGMVGWYQRPSYDAFDDLIFGDAWWVAQTAVNFNLRFLQESPYIRVREAILEYQETEWAWNDGQGNKVPEGHCVEVLGRATERWEPGDGKATIFPTQFANVKVQGHTPGVQRWYVTQEIRDQWIDRINPAHGFVLRGGNESPKGTDYRSCMSEIHDIKLRLTYEEP
jgi:hypothetical protein